MHNLRANGVQKQPALASPEGTLHVAIHIGLFHRFAFVVQFFPFAQSDEQFSDSSLVEIHSEWDECEPVFMCFACEFAQFSLVEEQFPWALWFMVPNARLYIFGDIRSN